MPDGCQIILRLAPVFPPDITIPMDGVDRMQYMLEFAQNAVGLDATIAWIQNHWNR